MYGEASVYRNLFSSVVLASIPVTLYYKMQHVDLGRLWYLCGFSQMFAPG